mmetsp:Transcript_120376/g.340615  ORF Transcript_120376/g.340615 Transcript_120376/m.340615 type:complete len:210 (-) Transcript_120376:2145-2774(-)
MHLYRSASDWKALTLSARAATSLCPSIRRYPMPRRLSTHTSTRSIIFTPCEKMSVRWPRATRAGIKAERQRSFALCEITESMSRFRPRNMRSTAFPASAPSAAAPSTCASSGSSHACVGARAPVRPCKPRPGRPGLQAPLAAHGVPRSGMFLATAARYSRQTLGSETGRPKAGWLQSLFSKPMARNTSTPSLLLEFASWMTSLVSNAFW